MKLESEQQEKELLQAVRIAGGEKKAKQRQRSLQSEGCTPSSAPLNVSCRSYGCKDLREDSIKVDDMESDREWDGVEIEVYNQLLPHRFTSIISEVEALYQVVSLATVWTLGMTLRPRRGRGDGRGSNDAFRSD